MRAIAKSASVSNGIFQPKQSLLLHAENTVIPSQVIINSPRGSNNNVSLLFGTSLYDLKEAQMPAAVDLTEQDGLRLFSPGAALVRVSASFFVRNPVEGPRRAR